MAKTYEEAKATRDALDAEVSRLSAILRAFPTGPMGLVPDAVKATPEYCAAKTEFDVAFQHLRSANHWFTRAFKREIARERQQRRTTLSNQSQGGRAA